MNTTSPCVVSIGCSVVRRCCFAVVNRCSSFLVVVNLSSCPSLVVRACSLSVVVKRLPVVLGRRSKVVELGRFFVDAELVLVTGPLEDAKVDETEDCFGKSDVDERPGHSKATLCYKAAIVAVMSASTPM